YVFLEKTDHADTLVLLADFLMQISGVNRALAAGVYGGKLVAVFRAGGLRLNVGRIAALAFSEYGSAGGHKNMARAEVPLENLEARTRGSAAALSRFVQRRLAEALKAR
ncbi:MAG: phosphoesterase, partial [Candidatus Adiutrix sp.]|nr:phosphoesterase [Candidatus Adiutrix sp.]